MADNSGHLERKKVPLDQLVLAARKAANVMHDTVNAEIAAGNDEFEDVEAMTRCLNELEAAISDATNQ